MYTAEINRTQPACVLMLIDQSFSMSESWAESSTSKAEELARAVNRILGNAALLCSKGDGRIYDYFEVGVFGYGAYIGPVLHGADLAQPILPISELAENPKRVDQLMRKTPDGAGGIIEEPVNRPVWVDPEANGKTPMVEAFHTAAGIVDNWCTKHPRSFPPIVLNVTDGASSDGDPSAVAESMRDTRTDDGNSLVFNLHLSASSDSSVLFPCSSHGLPGRNASMLFGMSSELPSSMAEAATGLGYDIERGAKGFLYNADAANVIEFLDIGTRAATPGGLKELTTTSDAADWDDSE